MSTTHPPGPLHHRAGQHTRTSQEFESHTGAHDIHDGIDRAYFVKVDFGGRFAMDLALGERDSFEDRDGFLLHPIRERTVLDEALNDLKGPTMVMVMFMVMVMWVLILVRRVMFVVFVMLVRRRMRMVTMLMLMNMILSMGMRMRQCGLGVMFQMHIELRAADVRALLTRDIQSKPCQPEFSELLFQAPPFHAQVE